MNIVQTSVKEAGAYIRSRTTRVPEIGLILGSGLGAFAEQLQDRVVLPTASIPGYPQGTVIGHKGRLVFARSDHDKTIVAFQGRIHFYECNDLGAVLFPVLVARDLGVSTLIITNAAGGVNREFHPGDLMIIRDQLNLTSEAPLHRNERPQPVRQPLYDQELVALAQGTAQRLGLPVRCGVYAGVKGPSYETAAEVEMVHRAGGDAVGMSTVLEVAEAAGLGMRVLGISCITNKATGIGSHPLDHAEVTEVAARVREGFGLLLSNILHAL